MCTRTNVTLSSDVPSINNHLGQLVVQVAVSSLSFSETKGSTSAELMSGYAEFH